MAKTLRLERGAAVTADTLIFPVAPTSKTVSIAVLSKINNMKDVKDNGCPRGPCATQVDLLVFLCLGIPIQKIMRLYIDQQ